jgi:hypothetical protein
MKLPCGGGVKISDAVQARLRRSAATERHPSRGSPSRSSRFGVSSRERRMVAQICPRWNRLQPWFELARAFKDAA